jgi:hypothetical protein
MCTGTMFRYVLNTDPAEQGRCFDDYVLAPRTRCMSLDIVREYAAESACDGHHSSSTTSTSRSSTVRHSMSTMSSYGAEHARYEARKGIRVHRVPTSRGYGRTKVCRLHHSGHQDGVLTKSAARRSGRCTDTSITLDGYRTGDDRPEERHLQDDEEARRHDGTIRMIHRKVGACGCNLPQHLHAPKDPVHAPVV